MNNLQLLLLFYVSVCLACSGVNRINVEDKGIQVHIRHHVIPILKRMDKNQILTAEVIRDSESPVKVLHQMIFDLSGTDDFSDILQVDLYEMDAQGTLHLISSETGISEDLSLDLSKTLMADTIQIVLSVQLSDMANIDHKFTIGCTQLSFDHGQWKREKVRLETYRFGIALRKHGDDGVDTYRIPGMVTSTEGTLLAVYDIRHNQPEDLQEDIDIGLSRSTDGGHTWSEMQVIMDKGKWGGKPEDQNGVGDPSILVDRVTGHIWVAGLWTHGMPGERAWFGSKPGLLPIETGQLLLTRSQDDGVTWEDPVNITHQVKDFEWQLLLQGPGTGISLEEGIIVFPAQYKDAQQVPHSTILYSEDHGKNWLIGQGARSKTTEAQVVQLSDGTLMLNMRDDRGGARAVSITRDMGNTWEEHSSNRKLLPEPVCNASLIMHDYKVDNEARKVLLFANPNDTQKRISMTIKASLDEGLNWPEQYHLLLDAGEGRGYPTMTSIDDETIGILYEGSQSDLVFQRIKLSDILGRRDDRVDK